MRKCDFKCWILLGMIIFVLAACGSSDNGSTDGDSDLEVEEDGDLENGENEVTDGDTDLIDEETETDIEYENIDSTIKNVSAVERASNVLSCTVYFDTGAKTRAEIVVSDANGRTWTAKVDDEYRKSHEIPVFYMYAETEYTFTVTVYDEENGKGEKSTSYTTSALPEDFPPIEVTVSKPDKMQSGLTLFNVWRWNPLVDINWGMLIVVDEMGNVVWYYKFNQAIFDVKMLSDGYMMFGYNNIALKEIDIFGEEHSEINAILNPLLGMDSLHHDYIELPDGTMLVLSTELERDVEYSDGEGGTVNYNVVGDVIHHIKRDATVIKSWSLFDYLDIQRRKVGFDETYWDNVYWTTTPNKDWTHANGLIYDESDNSFIVSVRHQDWLIKIDMDTDELVWKMGEEGDFTMQGEGQWMFHQHSPKFNQAGDILLYDNGNARSSYQDGDTPYTRVVEFSYDEEAKTVNQVWEYKGEEAYFVPFVGNVNELENTNILITDGAVIEDPHTDEWEPDNQKHIRITEITPGETPEKVFEIVIKDNSEDKIGYLAYRAVRVKSLNP